MIKTLFKINISNIFFPFILKSNVLKTGPVIEPEKLPVHGSLIGPPVEPLLNRYQTGDVINIYFIILYNIKIKKLINSM